MIDTPVRPFEERLASRARQVSDYLDARLSVRTAAEGRNWPEKLRAAMRHGVLNGGKRLRPFLVLETAVMLGGNPSTALIPAAALECVHCYSLVHDDLPAMDDDELRRGRPTVHVAFDEATAILAGDALLTFAFELVSAEPGGLAPETRLDLVRGLALAAGAGGMVGGQVLDLSAERDVPGEAEMIAMQAMKTGALLKFACVAGATVAGADAASLRRIEAFGERIGLAFQLADDLLDVTADAGTMGKATGKDAERNKATYVSLHGVEAAREKCRALVEEATGLLEPYGPAGAGLREAATFIALRDR